ncbi:nuclear transport factor 2 family protein [Paenibacillus sp. FSL L8-0436]|uniref:nuclear transport factor 2 family protein n=1 Tax=Paenibacillus sp. FSL L8-0436 TaxID=2954686 RepID=UPI00315981F0
MISGENQAIIDTYVEAYNAFDVEGMVRLLDAETLFKDFSNGEITTETRGIQEFKELAEKSLQVFSNRRQTITHYSAVDDRVEIQIDYEAILAVDLPNGLKTGDTLQLKGKSAFEIKNGKIALIEDYG